MSGQAKRNALIALISIVVVGSIVGVGIAQQTSSPDFTGSKWTVTDPGGSLSVSSGTIVATKLREDSGALVQSDGIYPGKGEAVLEYKVNFTDASFLGAPVTTNWAAIQTGFVQEDGNGNIKNNVVVGFRRGNDIEAYVGGAGLSFNPIYNFPIGEPRKVNMSLNPSQSKFNVTIRNATNGNIVKDYTTSYDDSIFYNSTYAFDVQDSSAENEYVNATFSNYKVYGEGSSGGTGNVTGNVTDVDGNAISGTTITLENSSTTTTTTTNASGGYNVTVDNGQYNITASKDGYFNATGTVNVGIGNTSIVDFVLTESDKPYIGGGGVSNNGDPATATPRGNILLNNQSTDLNFTVRDDSGGQVNYTAFHINSSGQFEQVGSGQVANNTRVSVPVTSLHGSNKWYVRINDSLNVQTSSVFRYRTPGVVTVFNGSSLNRLDGRTVDYTIRGANSNFRVDNTTNDGNISLNGVPDERLLLQTDATDYFEQTIEIRDPAKNYSVLMYPEPTSGLPNSSGNYQQSFDLDDLTGDFPPSDSTLEVESYLNGQYQLIAADSFGAQNLANVTLQDGEIYRLKVRNGGQVRSLGEFTGDTGLSSQTVTLTVTGGGSDGNLQTDPEGLWRYNASYNDSQQAIEANFDANDTNVQSVRVKIYERGNPGNKIYDSNYGAVEEIKHTQPLDSQEANKTWWVEFQVETNNSSQTARVLVGTGAADPTAALADWIKLALSVIVILMTGALFSQANIGVGMIVTPLVAGGFVLIGWTGSGLTAAVVVVALTVGLLVKYGGIR